MTNTRVGERLSKLNEVPSEVDRSEELAGLADKFRAFMKQFKPLTDALNARYNAMKEAEKAQAEVLDHLVTWSKDSPLDEGGENILNVHYDLLKKNQEYSDAYMSEIVSYVHEWEVVVNTRVDTGLGQVRELRQNHDHYSKKVKSLQKRHDSALTKKIVGNAKATDKLQRNEEKLAIAKNEYNAHVANLCNLIEEAVQCAWKDLHPLLLRIANLEKDRLDNETAIFTASGVIERLQAIADAYEIDITKASSSEPEVSVHSEEPVPSDADKENAAKAATHAKEKGAPLEKEDEKEKDTVSKKVKERGAALKQKKGHSLQDEDDTPGEKKKTNPLSKAKERGQPLE